MVKNDMQSVVVSEDEYRGIPVQKIRFEDGSIKYYSCGTWFEDFEEFTDTVDIAIYEENQHYTIDKSDFEEERENPFEHWLTDGKHGGALEMLDKYRMPEEKSRRLDRMKGSACMTLNRGITAIDVTRIERMVANAFMENVKRTDFEKDISELYGTESVNYLYAMHRYDSTTKFFDDMKGA